MRTFRLPLLLFLLFLYPGLEQARSDNGYYLNPGLKFSHTFGEHGGFTLGVELSYTRVSDRGFTVPWLRSIIAATQTDSGITSV